MPTKVVDKRNNILFLFHMTHGMLSLFICVQRIHVLFDVFSGAPSYNHTLNNPSVAALKGMYTCMYACMMHANMHVYVCVYVYMVSGTNRLTPNFQQTFFSTK